MSDERVHLDFESRSTQPFGKGADAVSVNQYANHPETDLWCMSWAIGKDKVRLWDPWAGEEFPIEMKYALSEGLRFVAHNAPFEFAMWNGILVPRFGLKQLPIEQMDCTAARASIMALPRSLGEAAKAMGLKVEKDDAGRRLMMKMAKPRRARKGEDPDCIWWHDSPENRHRLGEYCITDTEVERELDDVIAPMTRYQREQWLRVHRANIRGVMVDTRFVEKAKKVMAVVERGYCEKMLEATDGAVPAVSALPAMKVWLSGQGVDVSSLDKTSIIHLLEDHKDNDRVVKVLTLRQEAGKSSVAKLDRFSTLTNEQQRMLENFMFHAANTGRLGGKGAQLQNLPSRGGLKWNLAEQCIDIILATHDPEWACVQIELLFGEIPSVLSSCLRGCIIAPEGQKLFVADFSNIEGRVAAWLGNEQWKLKAFRLYDTPLLDEHGYPIPCKDDGFKRKGPDLYKVTVVEILGKPPSEIVKTERNVMGKVPELACLSPDTLVLTSRGYLAIVEVNLTDKLWDGVEWVSHEGLAYRGRREVIAVDGARMTSDHLVTCGSSWLAASELVSNRSILTQALEHASASLPLSARPCRQAREIGKCGRSVVVERCRIWSTSRVSSKGPAHAVIFALKKLLRPIASCITATRMRYRMTNIVDDYSTACPLQCRGAVIQKTACGSRMAGAAYKFIPNGSAISEASLDTYRPVQDGISLSWKWIAERLTVITRRVICGLSQNEKIRSTSGLSTILNRVSGNWSDVYDLVNAGPRNRFTVKTTSGHLVVHNCGFGGGVGAFASMAGIYNIDMADYHDTVRSAIDAKFYEKAEWAWNKFGKSNTTMSQRAWLASETVKGAWRSRHPGIVKRWADAETSAIKALQTPGKWFTFADGKCAFGAKAYGGVVFLISRLPSGRRLYRANASLKMVTKFGKAGYEVRFMGVDSVTRQWVRMSTYGGDLFQSFVQAIAYDLMDHGWKNVEEDGFEVVLSVHDELGAYADQSRQLEEFETGMNRLPVWAKGCPVSSAGYTAQRYRKD